ncbi:hypothetical protein PHLGIDRAFT_38084 [Phlebiopsis gigantea 11061_1 CR5-6]|uniref:Uncharacterized protein n=1 Tax=Phlebiopsis gigantea (strain 11061_1 CR5-6) TaxID=745531 RepID=A0A0C3NBW9_PHLG1|nr:hypothetical protein PHLGIDRAFT_38084 [Phlebiopsis gigantea 11061_1 CR5-6]
MYLSAAFKTYARVLVPTGMLTEEASLSLLAFAIEVVFESLVYGIFVVLVLVSTALGTKQGWKTRQTMIMLSMIWIMLILSTAHWAIDIALLVRRVVTSSIVASGKLGTTITVVARINYMIADLVLVWRSWVICRHEYPKTVYLSFFTSGLTLVLVMLAVVLRLVSDGELDSHTQYRVTRGLDSVLIGTLISSAITNLLATIVTALHVWNNRKFLRRNMPQRGPTRGVRILRLVVISGWLYSVYVCFVIIVSIQGAYFGALGSVSSVVLIHISVSTVLLRSRRRQGAAHEMGL